MGSAIVALGVLFLLQCVLGDPRPEFALDAPVPGTNRVSQALSSAQEAIDDIPATAEAAVIQSELTLLPSLLNIVLSIAQQYKTLATTVVSTVTTLAADTSGNLGAVYGAAIDAVDEATDFATNVLPGLTDQIVTLVGQPLVDKFEDSMNHIGQALEVLGVALNDLQVGAQNAIDAVDGSVAVPSAIVRQHLPRSKVSQLVSGLITLRATVPLLTYVIDSTVDGIDVADQYMINLSAKVDSTIGVSSGLAASLSSVTNTLGSAIGNTLGILDTDLAGLVTNLASLTEVAKATSAPDLSTTLGKFQANVGRLAAKDPSVTQLLTDVGQALIDSYQIVDPLYYIYQSSLVDTLITTLVANDKYSQYCFYKYKDVLFGMLESIAVEAEQCIDKEMRRLENYKFAIDLIFELLYEDFEDINNDMRTCNGITDLANLEECIASLKNIYAELEVSFGKKIDFGYSSLQHELKATGLRLKICIRLTQSTLKDTDVPLLTQVILNCAADGPLADED